MKTGLIGGAFDPIHMGHLKCAESAAELFSLDKVLFIPSANPPHKKKPAASAENRLNMISLALRDYEKFELCRLEIDRMGTSYTIDTVNELAKDYGADLYFILGLDAFRDIHLWKEAGKLLESLNFIVMARPGWKIEETIETLENGFSKAFGGPVFTGRTDLKNGVDLSYRSSKFRISIRSTLSVDISSTQVREFVGKGKSINNLVPNAVEEYIIDKMQYRG